MSSDFKLEAVVPRRIPNILYHYTDLDSALNIIQGGDNDEHAICFLLKNASSKNDELELKLGNIIINKVKEVVKNSGFNSFLNNVEYDPDKIYFNSFTENDEVNEYMLEEYGNVRLEFTFSHLSDHRYFSECNYLFRDDADEIADAYLSRFQVFKVSPSLISYCQYIPDFLSLIYQVPFIKFREKWAKESEWRHVFYEHHHDERKYQHNGFPKLKVFYPKKCLVGVTFFSLNGDDENKCKEYNTLQFHLQDKGWGNICNFVIFKGS